MRDNSNLRLLGLVMLLAPCARGQLAMKSVPELISSLANTEQRQNAIGVFGCGITQEFLRERSVARELASRGKAAVPELDRALGSLERDGEDSSFFDRTGWLLFAYARAQGPASVSTLMRMIRSPKLDSLHISLDRAIALSLGLTSYVSSGREGGPMFICRRPEPKDALDEFLLALERGDRSAGIKHWATSGAGSRSFAERQVLGSTASRTLARATWRPGCGGLPVRYTRTLVGTGGNARRE
jgi:hypothetical protein